MLQPGLVFYLFLETGAGAELGTFQEPQIFYTNDSWENKTIYQLQNSCVRMGSGEVLAPKGPGLQQTSW